MCFCILRLYFNIYRHFEIVFISYHCHQAFLHLKINSILIYGIFFQPYFAVFCVFFFFVYDLTSATRLSQKVH